MIDRAALLDALKPVLLNLEKDLRARSDAEPTIKAKLTAQYEAARASRRTAEAYSVWRDELVTQVAVGWVLGTVFIRFLEDNELLDHPWISGPGDRRTAAEHEREEYFRINKLHSDRDYLEQVFRTASELPGLTHLFDPKHNPLWQFGPSGDAVTQLLRFWQERNPDTGLLNHDFTDPEWDTRFLGDLYQDLSEAARKRYALLQTPLFIEEFILDRTLDPAIQTFGLKGIRMIDPTCGSGHFVLGGFERILKRWQQFEPATPIRELAQRALDSVFGVDLNPFAVGIARFRLLIAALKAVAVNRLKAAPNFRLNLAVGDSLLHGRRFGEFELQGATQRTFATDDAAFRDELKHHYEVEDTATLRRILGQQYHVVLGNPPYITVKDKAVSELYRGRYSSCRGKYSLSVPFMERFFELAVKGDGTPQRPAGFVGQITANSFMKNEFGKDLIEKFMFRWDVTHILDTAGAHIPEHGTPTVIIFGKNQPPVMATVRVVSGIKGEPGIPADPVQGFVWQAMLAQVDVAGSQSEWVSVADSARAIFHKHPWSLGGGGASELKTLLEEACSNCFSTFVEHRRGNPVVGFGVIMGEEECFSRPPTCLDRVNAPKQFRRAVVEGEDVRDWAINCDQEALFPYDRAMELSSDRLLLDQLWILRSILANRPDFSGLTYAAAGRPFWEYHQIPIERNLADRLIVFCAVSTHINFALNRGPKAFKQSAPIAKLKTEDERQHQLLLGVLNSSSAAFWLRQVCAPKGGSGIGRGIQNEPWEGRMTFNAAQVANIPVPDVCPSQLPIALVQTSTALEAQSSGATLLSWGGPGREDLRVWLAHSRDAWHRQRRQMIAWQEDLDWQIYESFKLIDAGDGVSQPDGAVQVPPDGVELGQRAFEIVMARKMKAGELQTTWFERHGSTPITEVPGHWPTAYRELVERRIQRIADDSNIRLIEQPEYKRRWNTEPWDEQLEKALTQWLLDRIERVIGRDLNAPEGSEAAKAFQPKIELLTTQQITDLVLDRSFREAAEIYRGRADFDPHKLVAELIQSAAVPFLPGQRYKESGLRKRVVWEETWDKQRAEDAIDNELGLNAPNLSEADRKRLEADAKVRKAQRIGDIPVPPKYASADFRSSVFWSLRGKLDVPKERFISYPGCSRDGDPCLTVAWAGLDPLQQAKALAAHYGELQQTGAGQPKLLLVLAGLNELLPWLKQWHNQLDPEFGLKMGDYYEEYVREEAKRFGKSLVDLKQIALTP
ncbi:MAG: BREX-2 system adenine-specific DNA-methyltransferase PglX [Verrucomicrobiae bacterium]|nr:BREX-2 system adenine-specific DNA-methyltransferase PglX [Verrucomicrobiae bacterium]